ncbi:hypothetical protein BAY60_32730 [Prauserella muralis]|uniref:Sortase family protein n=1 Tax=Prauserella muralis TaxID=588067 RepID=A0A2V4ALT8_9PSEU|nr:hypothetical protein BAY60_32730 [Prauserella muralis]
MGAAAAAVVVTLAAVLTGVALVRSGPAADGSTPSPGANTAVPDAEIEVYSGPVPPAHAPLPASPPRSLAVPAAEVGTGSLIELGRTPAGVTEVPGYAKAVGWLTEHGSPGERGPAVLTGHADFAYERGSFFRLRDVRPGDLVTVGRQDGTEAVFTVYRVEILPPELATARATVPTDQPDLRLLTASGDYDNAYSEHDDAVLVYARLTGVDAGRAA